MDRGAKVVVILLVLAVAGYALYVQVLKWHRRAVEASLDRQKVAWKTESERLQEEVHALKEELAGRQEAKLPEQKLREVFGEDAEGMQSKPSEPQREALDRKVREFFAYLDERDYVKAYHLDTGTLQTFRRMVDKLAEHPPVVSAEFKDPFLLIQNIAHLYRVLGKRDLRLARDVIDNESEIAEPVGALLFEWALPREGSKAGEGRPSLGTLYEYAGFFLESVGGRSYLMRRDPRIRILTRYYCVLVVDRANREETNRYGIDLRPHIDSVAEEIRSQRDLVYQQDYLHVLRGLQEKYPER